MRDETVFAPVTFSKQHRSNDRLSQGTLKRKFASVGPFSAYEQLCYPSPPMSNPPSPPRQPSQQLYSAADEPLTFVPAQPIPTTSIAPGLPVPAPINQLARPSPPSGYVAYPPAQPVQRTASVATPFPVAGSVRPGTTNVSSPSVPAEPGSAESLSTRTGRKSKAHVASACVNCKRAHLSCDVQRPCARCVTSGKQDTCFDTPHKKRGRPRLREESEPKIEQMLPEQVVRAGAPTASASVLSTPRPIAGTRHRRTDSLRSLRSQTSDPASAFTTPTSALPPPFTPQPRFGPIQPLTPSVNLAPAEVATAYLDLDFVFIRANPPFEQIMSRGQSVRGRRLEDVAAPADREDFQSTRNRIRAEREAREPAYMPPILSAGQDRLQGVSEADIDRLSQGFADRTYTWTRNPPSLPAETFPARVRLAKATTYFVVVTLPSFRPVVTQHPPGPSTAFAVPQPLPTPGSLDFQRPEAIRPMPSTMSQPYWAAAGPSPPDQYPPAQARAYQPYLSQQPYSPFQQPQMPIPRFPTADPFSEPTPSIAPLSARDTSRAPIAPMQLPPLTDAPAGQSSINPAQAWTQHVSSSEEEDEEGRRLRSPKKRRRMGIDDVLQR